MRHSWKQHVAAALVTSAVLTIVVYPMLRSPGKRDRSAYLAKEAAFYDSGGIHIPRMILTSFLVTIVAIVPYELTLAMINNKRLSGED